MGPLGYCHLLAVGSLDGLVEASRQSRVCAGVANPVSVAIFRYVWCTSTCSTVGHSGLATGRTWGQAYSRVER